MCGHTSQTLKSTAAHSSEQGKKYLNTNPKCEPQLGKRGLYGAFGGVADRQQKELSMLWVLNLSDGRHSLQEIADRSGIPFQQIQEIAQLLLQNGLLNPVDCEDSI